MHARALHWAELVGWAGPRHASTGSCRPAPQLPVLPRRLPVANPGGPRMPAGGRCLMCPEGTKCTGTDDPEKSPCTPELPPEPCPGSFSDFQCIDSRRYCLVSGPGAWREPGGRVQPEGWLVGRRGSLDVQAHPLRAVHCAPACCCGPPGAAAAHACFSPLPPPTHPSGQRHCGVPRQRLVPRHRRRLALPEREADRAHLLPRQL